MQLRSWSELAREAPDAPAIFTRSRTLSRSDVLAAIRARPTSDAPIVLVGSTTVEAVLDLLAAIDRGAPVLLVHPRWTEREAAIVRARLSTVVTTGHGDDRILAVVHTSGTSGAPKGAVLSRRAFIASATMSARHIGLARDDRWMLATPLAHVGGLGVVARSLCYETPLVVMERGFEPDDFLVLAAERSVTHVSLVPTMLAGLLDRLSGHAPPVSLKCILLGGAAAPAALLERARAAELPIHPTYGLTETTGQVATRRLGSVDALELLPGIDVCITNGTVRVRSPALFDGWLLELRSPVDADGFYDTGDAGELFEGRLLIHARRTDLIVRGGENVYPREVEDALERIPGVRAACVFGLPDARWGQRVAAAIVLDGEVADDAISQGLRSQLASFKMPVLLARLEALPLGVSGKVDRSATANLALPVLRPTPRW